MSIGLYKGRIKFKMTSINIYNNMENILKKRTPKVNNKSNQLKFHPIVNKMIKKKKRFKII